MATPKQWKRRGRWSLIIGTLFISAALVAVASGAVSTDQSDYYPGSVVTISGNNTDNAGYAGGETVDVAVSGPNGWTTSCQAVADDSGAWSCQVTLSDDSSVAVGSYTYTATGETSGVSQNGSFTDAPPFQVKFASVGLPTGTTVNMTVSYTNNGTHVLNDHTKSFNAPGPGATVSADPNTAIDFTFPATIGSCTLQSQSEASPDAGGASGGNKTITGTYSCAAANQAPTAVTGGPYSGNEGSAIQLDGSASHGNGTGPPTITAYAWSVDTTGIDAGGTCNFSDATIAKPTITCTDDSNGGTFDLALEVTDSNGLTNTAHTTLTVNNVKPTVTFDSNLDTNVNEHPTTTHHYTYTISDPGSNDTVATDSIVPSCGNADGAAASNAHNNSTSGSFDCLFPDGEKPANKSTLSVTATDDDGAASDAATLDVTVNNVAPTVNAFTPSANLCSVSISSIVATDPGQAYDNSYTGSIDWGDSSTDTSLPGTAYGASNVTFTGPFTHTYAIGGSYTITASVTDDDGDTGTKTAGINNTPTIGWPLAPVQLGNGNSKTVNTGSALPIKIKVLGCAAGLAPVVAITPAQKTVTAKGKSNLSGGIMRYDPSLPGFIYNWDTSGWAGGNPGTAYTITVTGLPGGPYTAGITLNK